MASETTPLLRGNEASRSTHGYPTLESHPPSPSESTFAHRVLRHWQRWKVLYLGILLIILVDSSGSIGIAPGMRLLEDLVCREFHRQNRGKKAGLGTDISDELCGLPDVQERLAKVRGVVSMLEALPGKAICMHIYIAISRY
jgi:hypothetical protein